MSFEFSREELAWAAGLFEGEGAICMMNNSSGYVALSMTDKDVVEKFKSIVRLPIEIRKRLPKNPNHKASYDWRTSRFEYVQFIIALFWNWSGKRRREQAKNCLRLLKKTGLTPQYRGVLKNHCPHGHQYIKENIFIDKKGYRVCRICKRKAVNFWWYKKSRGLL
jgi:hypothetical protein